MCQDKNTLKNTMLAAFDAEKTEVRDNGKRCPSAFVH